MAAWIGLAQAADVNIVIPPGGVNTNVYFNVATLGEPHTVSIVPAACNHFDSGPTLSWDFGVSVTGTGGECGGEYTVRLLTATQAWVHITGHIEPSTACNCGSGSDGGGGTPPPSGSFDVGVLSRLAWIYFTDPANGTNLTCCAGSTNDIAVKVMQGLGGAPISGNVTWTPAPANLGSVTPNNVALVGGNAASKFYAGTIGTNGLLTAVASGLHFAEGNPVSSVSTNITVNVVKMKIELAGYNDTTKVNPGGFVFVNNDDDNHNDTNDVSEALSGPTSVVVGDDDLLPITLRADGQAPNTPVTLTVLASSSAAGGIRIWANPHRGPHAPAIDNTASLLSATWPASRFPTNLYLEGVSASFTNADVVLWLQSGSCVDSAKVSVVNVDLLADTDRNGAIDSSDELGKNKWSVTRGAFITPDEWLAGNVSTLPNAQLATLAPIVIQRFGVGLAGMTVTLKLEGNTAARLVSTNSGNMIQVGPGTGPVTINPSLLATNALIFYAAATQDLSAFANSSGMPDTNASLVKVTLTATKGGATYTDTIAMQIAPVIFAWNSLSLERLYCENTYFPTTVSPGKQARYTDVNVWIQDIMELGTSRFSSAATVNQIADLQDPNEVYNEYIQTYMLPEGNNTPPISWHKTTWGNRGNGGNFETFPPYSTSGGSPFPFGRMAMLQEKISGTQLALQKLQAQRIQAPITLTFPSGNWMRVGHIDELFTFLDDSNVPTASPGLAVLNIMRIVKRPDLYQQEIAYGSQLLSSAMVTVTNAPNVFFTQKGYLQNSVTATDIVLIISNGVYSAGDYLLIDEENVLVNSASVSNNLTFLTVARNQDWSTAGAHGIGAPVYIWTSTMVQNAFGADSLNIRINDLFTQLQTALQKTLNFVPIPVLFASTSGQYVAATANMVNYVTDGSTLYMTAPHNNVFASQATVSLNALSTIPYHATMITDPNAWNFYHCLDGELHCGSNAKRTLPMTMLWWNLLPNWPN